MKNTLHPLMQIMFPTIGKIARKFSNHWKIALGIFFLPGLLQAGIITGAFSGWSTVSNLPAARQESAAALAGNELYAMGGEDTAGETRNTVWKYDLSNPAGGWTAVSNLPAGRRSAAAAVVNDTIYLVAGHDGTNAHGTAWTYDTSDPAGGWQSISNLPISVSGLGAASVSGKVYVVGGWVSGPVNNAYVYDPASPTAGWQSISNLPQTAAGTSMVAFEGNLYACGGRDGGTAQTTNLYRYNPAAPTGGWTELPGMPAPRRRHAMGVSRERLIVMAGESNGGAPTRTAFSFNPDRPSDGWQTLPNLPGSGEYAAGASDGSRVFCLGGRYGDSVQDGVCEGAYISGVTPAQGPFSGGTQVTITGIDLGGGSDISTVTVCGVEAVIDQQSATQVVVTTGAAIAWGTGHVAVVSASQGTTIARNAFAYRQPGYIGGGLGSWRRTCPVSGPRAGLAATTVDGHVWAIAGKDADDNAQSNVWEHHQTDVASWWNIETPLPTNVMNLAAVTVGRKVYVLGGYNSQSFSRLADCLVFDMDNPGSGWQSISNLPAARMDHAAAAVDGKIYVAGGFGTDGGTGCKKTVWRYDTARPSGGWTSISNLPAVRANLGMTALDGRLYVVGGMDMSAFDTVWEYNPCNPEKGWTALSALPQNRSSLGLYACRGRLFAMGGRDGSLYDQVYQYDPTKPGDGWMHATDLPIVLEEFGAATLEDEMFVVGGTYTPGWNQTRTVHVIAVQSGISPEFGPASGGTEVTINGGNLGSGSDITNVTLCGVEAAILGQNATQVVVRSGAAAAAGAGDVIVYSQTIGMTVASNAFAYRHPKIQIRDWSSTRLTNDEPASIAHKTDFQGVPLNQSQSCGLTMRNSGTVDLLITHAVTNGSGAAHYAMYNCPTSVPAGETVSFSVQFTPTNFETATASVSLFSTATSSPFVIHFSGYGMDVSADNGPYSGGNLITIYGDALGDGGDITNVTVCGIGVADIVAQTATSVTVEVTGGVPGSGDIVVQSSSEGTAVLTSGYTYNPRGYVVGALDGWTAVSNMPVKRYRHGMVSVGSRLFVYGGSSGAMPDNQAYAYDTAHPDNGWTTLSNMPAARWVFAAAAADDRIFCVGGTDGGTAKKQNFVYDPATPEDGWSRTNQLPVSYSENSGAASGTRIYSVGGTIYDGGYVDTPVCYEYDVADPLADWTQLPDMPYAFAKPGAVALNGILYVAAGQRNYSSTDNCMMLPLYAPGQGWTVFSNLPVALNSHAMAAAYGKIYVLGGNGPEAVYSRRVYAYNPTQPDAGWHREQNLPSGRYLLAAASVSNVIYISGGNTSGGNREDVYKSEFGAGIVPQYAALAGGNVVTLSGVNLGNGSDITNVTLAGIEVTGIISQSATQVVVTAGGAPAPTSGAAAVWSVSHGMSLSKAVFSYQLPEIAVLGTNGQLIGSGEAASAPKGTDFGAIVIGGALTHECYITNAAWTALAISGVTTGGTGAGCFVVEHLPATVDAHACSNWSMRFEPAGIGLQTATVYIASDATNSPYAINLQGTGCALSTNNGPGTGGNTLVLDGAGFGDGGDITNVTICGVTAGIVSQSATQLVLTVGGPGSGMGDIRIDSVSAGTTIIPYAYTYNPSGYIFSENELIGWQSISNLPAGRNNLAATALNGWIYVIGGNNSGARSNVYAYCTATPEAGWISISNLPVSLRQLAATAAGGKVYAVGGRSVSGAEPTVYAYDPEHPASGWTAVSNLPAPVMNQAAVPAGDYIYSIGGKDSDVTNAAWRYDVTQPENGWTVSSNLPTAFDRMAGISVDGVLYAIAGDDGSTRTNVLTMDGAAPDGWTEIAGLPDERRVLAGGTAWGKVYAIGGKTTSGNARDTVFEYDPARPERGWVNAAPLPNLRANLAAASLDNTIYAIAGENGAGAIVSTVYESRFASGVAPAQGHTAGGQRVVISGTNLGNGGDITNIYLCGIPVEQIISQCDTQAVVTAAASGGALTGDVAVCSVSYGTTVKSNAFAYGDFHDTVYIAEAGSHTFPYNSWPRAATNFEDALGTAVDGTAVWVSNGTYALTSEIIVSNAVTVRSMNGADVTRVNGNYPRFTNRCFRLTHADALLEGLTITNGVTLTADGGGVRLVGGGAVRNCILTGNRAVNGGGAYAINGGAVDNCVIRGNSADSNGGGLYLRNSGGSSINCLLVDNTAGAYGGGAYIYAGDTIYNAAICDNTAGTGGDGTAVEGMGTLENCIIYFNGSQNVTGVGGGMGPTYRYVCTTPNPGGTGVITDDPLLIDRPAGNFRPGFGSPCIDSGTTPGIAVTNDLDENPRPVDGLMDGTNAYDIGAYEYDPCTWDTDSDGLCDSNEVYVTFTCPTNADTDGDRMNDGNEIYADTCPTNAASYFHLTAIDETNSCAVSFVCTNSRVYTLQYTSNMVEGTWWPVSGSVNVTGDDAGTMSLTDTVSAVQRTYRVGVSQ